MTLTPAGCARLWLSAQGNPPPQPWEGRAACRGCPVGALAAGQRPEHSTEAIDQLRHVCARCGKVCDRIIGGRLCVSCYNRDREAALGRNARGKRPELADRLHPASIIVQRGNLPHTIHYGAVLNMEEVLLSSAKSATGAVTMARPRVAIAGSVGQLEMAL